VGLPLPNATDVVNSGQTENLDLDLNGHAAVYDWSLVLTVVVNEHRMTKRFGSESTPLRTWLGDLPRVAYDYDALTHSWRRLTRTCLKLPLSRRLVFFVRG